MARLTRDFTGRRPVESVPHPRRGRAPAWSADVMRRRESGARIGLLLVSVDEWRGGEVFAGRAGVARVAALPDYDIEAGDWSCAAGLDCLVCGDAVPERFDAAVAAVLAAPAASVWGEYAEGVFRLAALPFQRSGRSTVVSVGSAVPVERLGAELAAFREVAMLMEDGFYGQPVFAAVREARVRELLA